jgi:hypothetical protein
LHPPVVAIETPLHLRIASMATPPENKKAEDVVQGPFIPLREPPGRLGAIVRRMKRMASPPPAPGLSSDHSGAMGQQEKE